MEPFHIFIVGVILIIVFLFLRNDMFSIPTIGCGCSAVQRGHNCPFASTKDGCPYRHCPRVS